MHRLARGPECHNHYGTCEENVEEVCCLGLCEARHEHRLVHSRCALGIREGVEASNRHADKVHEVVTRKGEGEGECSGEDVYAQDAVMAKCLKNHILELFVFLKK